MPSDSYILPARRRFKKLARLVFATAWTLVACEMFLRIFAPQALMPRAVTWSEMGIRVNTPGATYWQQSPEVKVRVHINSQGMRADRDFPLEKPAGMKRIVVLGDSFGLGAEVNLEETFASRLAARITESGQKVEIINLSVAGYGTAEELITLRGRGFAFHPDLVLLAFHPTDLADNVNSRLFVLKDGQLVRDQLTYYPGLKTRKRLERIPGYQWMDGNCQLYTFIRDMTAGNLEAVAAPSATPHAPPAPGTPPTAADLLAVALLEQIQTDAAQHGIKLLILDIPRRVTRTEFYSEFPYRALSEGQLDVISPLQEFKKHVGEKLFWEHGNFHFSDVGSRIVGDVLADHILDKKLFDSPRTQPLATER